MTTKVMTPRSGKGKELSDLLRRELGIPPRAKSFRVTFGGWDKPIEVEVEYFPEEPKVPSV